MQHLKPGDLPDIVHALPAVDWTKNVNAGQVYRLTGARHGKFYAGDYLVILSAWSGERGVVEAIKNLSILPPPSRRDLIITRWEARYCLACSGWTLH